MYTQCPSCRTLFRISEQQLAAAKGKVRCGKCNHIYNAQGTLMNELPKPAAPLTAKPEATPAPASPQLHKFENFDIPASADKLVEETPVDESWQEPDFNIVSDSTPPAETETGDDWLDSSNDIASDTSSIEEQEDDDDWLFSDDETEIPSISHLQQNLDADDIQVVNLGSDSTFSSDDSDDDDDWLFDDDELSEEQAQDGVDIVLRDEDDNIDIVLGEEEDSFDITEPATESEPEELIEPSPAEQDEEQDSDFMHHMSDYLDDDRADELISDESAADILNEVNQQLNLAIENPEPQAAKRQQGINIPGEWMDDFDQAINSADEISDEDREKQELNDAILKGLETKPARQPEPVEKKPEPAKAELSLDASADDQFQTRESIVLEGVEELDIGHRIGQHDNVPLRLRDSVGIEAATPRSGLKWITIFSSIFLLCLLLLVQVVMFRSVDLANMYPGLQPTLVSLCESLPCRDSRPFDVTQIRLLSRNISQHPKTKSALLIKAAIINRANFAQRYPKIQITLFDVTGDTVAQRIFYPQEYLGTLYHPFLTMKPSTPVHIALEVMDPGSAAINFEFQFL